MSCPDEATLHDLVDGELAVERREAVERHLGACPRCRGEVEAIRGLLAAAARLPERIDPPRELWSRISRRTTAKAPVSIRRPPVWLAAAAAVTLLVAAFLLLGRTGDDAPPGLDAVSADRTTALPAALTGGDELARLTDDYVDATRRLLDAIEARGAALPGEERAELDRSLALIDRAIEQVQLAVDRRPGDAERQRTLHALYRQKMDVLWRVSRLAS